MHRRPRASPSHRKYSHVAPSDAPDRFRFSHRSLGFGPIGSGCRARDVRGADVFEGLDGRAALRGPGRRVQRHSGSGIHDGVRTFPGRDVVLAARAIGPSGPSLAFAGRDEGVLAGSFIADGSAVLARWVGGGQRRGRVTFTLDGVAPGVYAVPVRFSVSVL